MRLVDALAARWGYQRGGGLSTTWLEILAQDLVRLDRAQDQPRTSLHRHIGLISEAILAERATMREAVASAMAPPGTDPESAEVTSAIERMRAGESAVAITSGERSGPRPRPGQPEERSTSD